MRATNSVTNIRHLGVKELRSLLRDPMMGILIASAFTVSVYLSATAMPETLHRVPIAAIDEDRSPLSTRIVDALYPPHFVLPALIRQKELDARMDAGLDTFALIIPSRFQQDVLTGRSPTIQINVDASRMGQAFTGNGYVEAIVTGEVKTFVERHPVTTTAPVDLALRVRFNPELNKSWFGAVMKVIDNITMLSIILTGAALIREREHDAIEHLLGMPVTPFQIMVGKVWAIGPVVLVASALSLTIVVQGLLGVPVEGSVILFLAGASLQLFATTAMAIFLATLARSMPQFGLLLMLVLLPMQMLSGGVTPRESMPEFVQDMMRPAPNTHFVLLAQAIPFRGAGLSVVWPQFVALAVIGAILFSLSLVRLRRTLSQMA